MDETAGGWLHGWVWRTNTRPFFESVAGLVGYSFDQLDLDAVTTGLEGSDAELEDWFEYPLVGRSTLTVRCASDVGADEHVLVEIDLAGVTEQVAAKLEVLLDVFSAYEVRPAEGY